MQEFTVRLHPPKPMLSDLRFAVRSLIKTPGFSAVSILILALGIGAVTAVFSAVDAVLLRPLPFERSQDLYCLQSGAVGQVGLFSIPEFCAYRDQNRTFSGVAAVGTFSTTFVDKGEAEFVQGVRLSANTFELLGVHPAAGRLLVPDDDRPGAPRVVVIAASLWQRSFGGRQDAIGETVTINGLPYSIVGVLPPGFILPVNGYYRDVFLPLQADADPVRYKHGSLHFLSVIGRIAPGATEGQALSDMAGILKDLRLRFPLDYAGKGENRLISLTDQTVGATRPMLLTLLGMVAALLLLASSNLAGLHLVRTIGRQHDFAIRAALGASKLRLMRLALAECLLLAAAGGMAGLLFARWGLESLISFVPADVPRIHELSFDATVFGFAALVSLGFGLAPALAPVWLVSRSDLRGTLAAGGGRTVGGHRRVRHFLASIQVALALTLLACTALFLRSFWAASSQRLGFDTSNALALRLTLPETGYRDRDQLVRHCERLQARLASIPGVESVGATSLLPLAAGLANVQFSVTGQATAPQSELPTANYRLVTPGYFEAMRIPLREGRAFTDRDDPRHPFAAIISSALAKSIFPGRDALGQRLDIQDKADGGARTAEIVGIVGDVKQVKIEEEPSMDIYIPYRQMDSLAVPWIRYRNYWILRGSATPAAMESALRREIRTEDPSIAISSVHTLEQVSESALASRRFTLLIVGFFAGAALLLTIAGIYSVIAFGVAQRTREIGVRLALGAKGGQIFALVLRDGLGIIVLGAPIGIFGSFVLSRLIAAQLYGVSPRDPLALSAAVLIISLVAYLACWLPARRAARVDPVVALRAD